MNARHGVDGVSPPAVGLDMTDRVGKQRVVGVSPFAVGLDATDGAGTT